MKLSVDECKNLFNYEPETGKLTWKVARFTGKSHGKQHIWPGDDAGSLYSTGYIVVVIGSVRISAHKLAWALMTGAWPDSIVDHEDGNGTNNRWSNLRLATSVQNNQNRRLSTANTSGVKGVSWSHDHKKWRARFSAEKSRKLHVGYFDSVEEASEAIKQAREHWHKEFCNHG